MGDFATGYLVGQMAEGHFRDLETTVAKVFSPPRDVVSLADYQALATWCAQLEARNDYLERDRAVLERNLEKMEAWGDTLDAELKHLKAR